MIHNTSFKKLFKEALVTDFEDNEYLIPDSVLSDYKFNPKNLSDFKTAIVETENVDPETADLIIKKLRQLEDAGASPWLMRGCRSAIMTIGKEINGHIGSAPFVPGSHQAPAALSPLFEVAGGSRKDMLGKGEIHAFFYFENANPPDTGAGKLDIKIDNFDCHVKSMTNPSKRKYLHEEVPGKRIPLFKAMETLHGDVPSVKEFVKAYAQRSGVTIGSIAKFSLEMGNDADEAVEIAKEIVHALNEGVREAVIGRDNCLLFYDGPVRYYVATPDMAGFHSISNRSNQVDQSVSITANAANYNLIGKVTNQIRKMSA